MAHKLYCIVVAMVPFAIFLSFSCKPVVDPTVGSPQDTQIPNASVTIDSTKIYGLTYYAYGKVTNNGTTSIAPPWYVECQFYTDSTFSIKLGGSNTSFTFPLDRGQSTFWTIYFSPQGNVGPFPNFKVKDQRAIYKKTS